MNSTTTTDVASTLRFHKSLHCLSLLHRSINRDNPAHSINKSFQLKVFADNTLPRIYTSSSRNFAVTRCRLLTRASERINYIDALCNPFPVNSARAVPVQVAHELLNAGHRFLDVRTAEEFAEGHIDGAVNIPYMFKVGSGFTKNQNFITDVIECFSTDDEIIVGCKMGKNSHLAMVELIAAGFTGVTDMAGGYSAWIGSGMPMTHFTLTTSS